jgi:hypothetical protein
LLRRTDAWATSLWTRSTAVDPLRPSVSRTPRPGSKPRQGRTPTRPRVALQQGQRCMPGQLSSAPSGPRRALGRRASRSSLVCAQTPPARATSTPPPSSSLRRHCRTSPPRPINAAVPPLSLPLASLLLPNAPQPSLEAAVAGAARPGGRRPCAPPGVLAGAATGPAGAVQGCA